MAATKPPEFMIYHPEKVQVHNVINLLLLKRRLAGSKFVDSPQETKSESSRANWLTGLTLIFQKILLLISGPLNWFGDVFEFSLNFLSLNGGITRSTFRLLTGRSWVIPKRDSANYRSFIGHLDGRIGLYKLDSFVSHLPQLDPTHTITDIKQLDLCMMASKIAYENHAFIENAVTNNWKMHFIGFFNCWNEFLEDTTTQAFIFCDKPENAQLIILAFRGTEPFNAKDWSTDIDLSMLYMGKMGRAHLGFMKALGLQNDKDYRKGWPKKCPRDDEDKPLAYYTLREKLKTLLQQHKDAKILLTGHSLGGALAILFPSLLILHEEATLLSRLMGVFTFGQPRVGDHEFGNFMDSRLNKNYKKYYRVVYRYDLATRVPFDDPVSEFKHFGYCLYYGSWYNGKILEEEPNGNYFNLKYLPSKHFNALLDLLRAIYISKTHGEDFKEGWVSILFRFSGLLVPGVASHSMGDYVNAVRLGKITLKHKEMF